MLENIPWSSGWDKPTMPWLGMLSLPVKKHQKPLSISINRYQQARIVRGYNRRNDQSDIQNVLVFWPGGCLVNRIVNLTGPTIVFRCMTVRLQSKTCWSFQSLIPKKVEQHEPRKQIMMVNLLLVNHLSSIP